MDSFFSVNLKLSRAAEIPYYNYQKTSDVWHSIKVMLIKFKTKCNCMSLFSQNGGHFYFTLFNIGQFIQEKKGLNQCSFFNYECVIDIMASTDCK